MCHHQSSSKTELLYHINSIEQNIQFTAEEPRADGSIPFLDILITPCEDGSLTTTFFRKPTHTDLYMQWDSHHAISSKYSVIGTLHHRANTICSSTKLLQHQEQHLKRVLAKCKYPVGTQRGEDKDENTSLKEQKEDKSFNIGHQQQNPYIVVPNYE